MTIITLDIALPAAPGDLLKAKGHARAIGKLTEPIKLPIDQASPRFFHRDDPADESAIAALFGEKTVDEFPEDDEDAGSGDEDAGLRYLDPKDWKQQDHYVVLGLQNLRFRATPDDIKDAYRKQVLKHHPDKKAAKAATLGYDPDAVFKCIQKAHETLSDPNKRQQYDSVDYGMDDSLPTESEISEMAAGPEYFDKLDEYFVRESRFCKVQPVPRIGNIDSPRADVENFYNFWYNFESWRTFSYEDKEDVDNSENRGDKRWIEKKNKAERARKKTEDNARLRRLVDMALKYDMRMKKFKEEDKSAKKRRHQQIKGKVDTTQNDAEKKKQEEEAKQAALAAEQEIKQQEEEKKKAKKEQKELIKKEKKTIKQMITKEFTYLHKNPTAADMERTLADIEHMLNAVGDDVQELEHIREELEYRAHEGIKGVSEAFNTQLNRIKQEQADAGLRKQRQAARAEAASQRVARAWTTKELQVLIKGANMLPGGTIDRWEKIAEYVAEHSGERPARATADVIAMCKQVQRSSGLDEKALKELQSQKKVETIIKDAPSIRDEYETGPDAAKSAMAAAADTWTSAQQEQLQKALKLYPPTYKEADRFDRVAELVKGKTKKECMFRIKYLTEQIKAKKTQK